MNAHTSARLLLTGGAGYIGSHVAHAAVDAGHAVMVIDDLSVGLASNLPVAAELVVGDAGNAAVLDRAFAAFRPDAVVHLSGIASVAESVAVPARYYRENTVASLTVIEACLRHGVGRLIFSSSASVYGTPAQAVVAEDADLVPISP
jgi:UDP-glucose 4-epimerase